MLGLDDLIAFVVDKLALTADDGANRDEIARFAREFYENAEHSTPAHDGSGGRKYTVDDKFLEKLIQWLSAQNSVEIFHTSKGGDVSTKELRLRTSAERMWYTIAGHPPDDSRIRPMEFRLLSIIAQHGSAGITQPDLMRLSGQDKRSLPHRTDLLRDGGYIEKKTVSAAGIKTSLCTLAKYVQQIPDVDVEAAIAKSESLFPHFALNGDILLPERFLDISLRVIKSHGIIELDRFRAVMGLGANTSGRKWVKAARKFMTRMVTVGCVQQLSVVSESKKKTNCLKYVKEPSEEAKVALCAMTDTLPASLTHPDPGVNETVDVDEDDGDQEPTEDNSATSSPTLKTEATTTQFASWDPERPILNQIFDAVQAAGSRGLSGMDVGDQVISSFWRRPLDNVLIQLTDSWQTSQPPSLRHLAIVRDSAQSGRIVHYQYYTQETFAKAVEAGQSSWEAIGGNFAEAKEALDHWGFPIIASKDLVHGDGTATISECCRDAQPDGRNKDLVRERTVRVLSDGGKVLSVSSTFLKDPVERRKLGMRPLGRPRKSGSRRSGAVVASKKRKFSKVAKVKPATQAHQSELDQISQVLNSKNEDSRSWINSADAKEFLDRAWDRAQLRALDEFRNQIKEPSAQNTAALIDRSRTEVPSENNSEDPNLNGNQSSVLGKRQRALYDEAGLSPKRRRAAISALLEENEPMSKRAEDLYNCMIDLSIPGAYLNHPARRKPGRGRPRRDRLDLTIKSHRLHEFDWFKSATTDSTDPPLTEEDSLQDKTTPAENTSSVDSTKRLVEPRKTVDDTTKHSRLMQHQPRYSDEVTSTRSQVRSDLAKSQLHQDESPALDSQRLDTHTLVRDESNHDTLHANDLSVVSSKSFHVEATGDEETRDEAARFYTTQDQSFIGHAILTDLTASAADANKNGIGQGAGPETLITRSQVNGGLASTAPTTYPDVSDENPQVVLSSTPMSKKRKSKPRTGVQRDQGTVAWKRSNILLEALQKAGGVFPGPSELQHLLLNALTAQSTDGEPDTKTASRVVKNLLASGKLKRFVFAFHHNGVVQQAVVYALPEYTVDSEAVKNMQNKIISVHPKRYLPPGVEITRPSRYPDEDKLSREGKVAVPRKTREMPKRTISAKQAMEDIPTTSLGFHRWAESLKTSVGSSPSRKRKRLVQDDTSSQPREDAEFAPEGAHESATDHSFEVNNESDITESSVQDNSWTRRTNQTTSPHKRVRFIEGNQYSQPDVGHKTPSTNGNIASETHPVRAFINSTIVGTFGPNGTQMPADGPRRVQAPAVRLNAKGAEQSPQSRADNVRSGSIPLQPPKESILPPSHLDVQKSRLVNPKWRLNQRAGRVCRWPVCNSGLPLLDLLREAPVLGLLANVLTTRVVLGGDSQCVDWPLVGKLMPKKYDHYVLASQWRQIENSHFAEINLLQFSFQRKFLEAYEANTLPTIDFNAMHLYDWQKLSSWTENQISSLIDPIPEYTVDQQLQKKDLTDYYTIDTVPVEEQSNELMFKPQTSITRRLEYMRDTGFYIALDKAVAQERFVSPKSLSLAKSFIRALLNTVDESYDASRARAKLSLISSHVLDAAVTELVKERHIRHLGRGRPAPGRSFGFTDNFHKSLNFYAKHGKFRGVYNKAIQLKEKIDVSFAQDGFFSLSGVAADHHGLIVGSLFSEDRISLSVVTPEITDDPKYDATTFQSNPTLEHPDRKLSVWGMARGDYKTSFVNLNNLIYPLKIYPTKKYVDGIPLPQPLPGPPSPHLSGLNEPKHIPIWYDINGSFLPEIWNKFGLSVIRLMHQRPKLKAKDIVAAMNCIVDVKDVLLLQNWLVGVGVVRGEDMTVKEWWWAVFPSGDENVENED